MLAFIDRKSDLDEKLHHETEILASQKSMNYKPVSNKTGRSASARSVRGHDVRVEEVTSIMDSGNIGG